MEFLILDPVYAALIILLLLRLLVSSLNLTIFVTVCVPSCLSFVFFESRWAFSFLVFCLLKDSVLFLFTSLKTVFLNIKFPFFFDKNEEERDNTLAMKEKEQAVSIPDIRDNPANTEDQSNTSEDKSPGVHGTLKVAFPGPHKKVVAEMEAEVSAETLSDIVDVYRLFIPAYLLVVFNKIIPLCMQHLDKHGYTIKGRRYAARNVGAVLISIITSFSLFKGTENQLINLAKKSMPILFNGAVRIEELPENASQLGMLRRQVEKLVGTDLLVSSTVSGEFFEAAGEAASEFFFYWIQGLTEIIKGNQEIINLEGFNRLSQEKRIRMINGYNSLPEQGKLFLKDHCTFFYDKTIEINDLLGGLTKIELIDPNRTQSSFSFQQGDVPTTSRAPLPADTFYTIKRVQLGSLLSDADDEFFQQQDISPRYSYEDYSTNVGPRAFLKHLEDQAIKQVERAESLAANPPNIPALSRLQISENKSSNVQDQYGSPGTPGYHHFPISSDQDNTNPTIQGRSSDTQIVSRGQSSSSSSDYLGFSAFPAESLEKGRHLQLAGFGLCVGALLTTSRVALGVLSKLNFTQELVKKMTDRGLPKWLFFWIHHSNPGPLPEKPLFFLMVCILAVNLIILYVLMVILHIIP